MLFSRTAGVFEGLNLHPDFKRDHIIEITPWVNPGDEVKPFGHAAFALGSAFQRFSTLHDAELASNWPHEKFSLKVTAD